MIYSDGVHVVSDIGLEDLHKEMERIGIKRCWYHSSSRHKHYDIPKKKRATFFADNPDVKQVTAKEIVEICKKVEAPTGLEPVLTD